MDGTTLYRIALGKDRRPDSWQLALATSAWPRVLVAPTGSGKTAAVTLGWAARRLRSPGDTPRRLVWCLPMRTLVEQTARAVAGWFGSLAADATVRARLPGPDDVHVLMGGVEADRWLDWPERPAVLVGTQDMLLSRALMRGYASSRAVWPMEFALLHEDAQWVFDEVQLMGAGRATSAQLEAFRQAEADRALRGGRTGGMPSRSLWISATLDPSWLATVDHPAPPATAVVRVDPAAVPDSRLARLANAAKRLSRSPVSPASSKKNDVADYIARLADAILEAHRPENMTLAIVNRVDRAQALRTALEKRQSRQSPAAPTLALVHSRFRPPDRERELKEVVAADDPNPHGCIVVATQAVEAGVDIAAAVLFTELAPWSSLVQRFGRANRYAELPDGADVRWIDLLPSAAEGAATDKDAGELARPYEAAELQPARDRLAELSDVAPVHLRRLVVDLLANGERRIRDGHHEDALVRAYRTLELVGQARLFERGLDSGNLDPNREAVKGLQRRLEKKNDAPLAHGRRGELQAGRQQVARLLRECGDPLGKRLLGFEENPQLKPTQRNNSVLVHGFAARAPADPAPLRGLFEDLESLVRGDEPAPEVDDWLRIARSPAFGAA